MDEAKTEMDVKQEPIWGSSPNTIDALKFLIAMINKHKAPPKMQATTGLVKPLYPEISHNVADLSTLGGLSLEPK